MDNCVRSCFFSEEVRWSWMLVRVLGRSWCPQCLVIEGLELAGRRGFGCGLLVLHLRVNYKLADLACLILLGPSLVLMLTPNQLLRSHFDI